MALTQTIRCMITLNPDDPSDQWCVNTWHIASVDATTPVTAAAAFKGAVQVFYNTVDQYLTGEFSGKVPTFKAYNLLEVKPRVPIYNVTMSALTTGSARQIRELSQVVSYHASYVSGVNPQRRRGRIYLGPLFGNSVDTSTGLLGSSQTTTIAGAAGTLLTASDASTEFRWVVYSPTTDTAGTGETGMYAVDEGWVDSTPDIQRRRGVETSVRTPF